jgi:hypothetical protein
MFRPKKRAPLHPAVYEEETVRLQRFVWRTLDVVTDQMNEELPERDRISVSGLIEAVILAALPLETLRSLAVLRPELFQVLPDWEYFKRPPEEG